MKEVSQSEFDKPRNFLDLSAQKKADAFDPKEDFKGTLFEFDLAFEWVLSDDKRILISKASNKPYTGLVHIQDSSLDEATYPDQEQKIKVEDGEIKFVDSREV